MQAGLRHFGENYLQEALDKIPAVDSDAVWHFIGPVQSNKTRQIAENFDWVHTVTSRRIAERLSAQRPVRSPGFAYLYPTTPTVWCGRTQRCHRG